MKRINPNTGKIFKTGDKREDGFIFSHYKLTKIKADGFYAESWNSPKSQNNKDKSTRERLKRKAEAAKKNPGKQRLNPKTGKKFMLGEYIGGKYFLGYNNRYIKLNGYVREIWGNWDTYHSDDPFKTSGLALYKFSPIAEDLKVLDKEIVLNSIKYKWNHVKSEFEVLTANSDFSR